MRFTLMETIYPQLWALIIVVSMVSGTVNDYDGPHLTDSGRFKHLRGRQMFVPTPLSPIISSSLFNPEPWDITPMLPPNPPTPKPKYCQDQRYTIKLNFSNMSMGRFDNGVIDYRDVVSLNLSHNFIKHVPADSFIHLPLLNELDLSFNQIPVINLLRFKNLTRLVSLYLNDNNVTREGSVLSQTDDGRLPHLKKLSLEGNRITDFTVSLKDFSPHLTHLFLSRNKIKSTEFLNDVPPTLTHLVLDDNSINRIEDGNMDLLHELSMNRNKLEVVCIYECSAYSLQLHGMRRLAILRLASNNIERIELGHNISNHPHSLSLHTLDLSYNHLTEIPSNIMNEFYTVKHLVLRHNQISEIPKVCTLKGLHTLDLSGNRITIVPSESFCNIMLHELNLSDNQISTIQKSAFNIGVRTLDLSGNHVSKLDFPWITHPGNLHILRVENNSIANFVDINLTGMNNLREMYITRNPLTHIVMNNFIGLMPNFHIYFHDEKDCIVGNSVQDDDEDESSAW